MNRWLAVVTALLCAACAAEQPSARAIPTVASATPSPMASAEPTPVVRSGASPVLVGAPIDLAMLTGRIVFDDFEDADGTGQQRVTSEQGQFVAWSPDGDFLLISGRTLYVVRPDGTGRVELRPPDLPYAPGGIPDWTR